MEKQPEVPDRDAELLRLALEAPDGDCGAFEELMARHQNRILANCRYLTRDENNSEDLAQEVFVKAFFSLRSFEGRSSFRHWLQRIKVNHCLNHLKKGERQVLPIDEESLESFQQLHVAPVAEQNLGAQTEARTIEAILDSMPTTLRVPLVMADMDELSYEEIAASLGLGLSAVKMRIKRAREQFRQLYQPMRNETERQVCR